MDDVLSCPKCGANWQGSEIPIKDRKWYGGATHFSRVIGIEEHDMVARWRCPDCQAEFPRARVRLGAFRTEDGQKVVH